MLDPDQLITLALEGASVKTLAAEFEISERHVRRILEPVKDQLLPKEARSKPLTDADLANIRQMRDEGQTESDILTTFHIDHATYRSI